MNIEEIVFSLKNNDIVVPEFQREFVWPNRNIKELFTSLLNGFPIGGILIWRTAQPPALKGLSDQKVKDNQKVYQVLLDGQQRMTTIYMLVTGEMPPYYDESDIAGNDPRGLCYNLQTREFTFRSGSIMDDESWEYVTEILKGHYTWHTKAISQSNVYKKIKDLRDFEFDFNVADRSRVFGDIRTLIESTGLKIRHASKQIWKIIMPTGTVETTIDVSYL